jgi:hypothetical protein
VPAHEARVLLALGRVEAYQDKPKRVYKRKDMEAEAAPVVVAPAVEVEPENEGDE